MRRLLVVRVKELRPAAARRRLAEEDKQPEPEQRQENWAATEVVQRCPTATFPTHDAPLLVLVVVAVRVSSAAAAAQSHPKNGVCFQKKTFFLFRRYEFSKAFVCEKKTTKKPNCDE